MLNDHDHQRFQKQLVRIRFRATTLSSNGFGRDWYQIDQSNQDDEQTVLWYHLAASVDFGLVTSILRMQPRLFNSELARFDLCPCLSYTRFVEFVSSAMVPLIVYLRTCCLGQCSGISFMDSTSLDVCLNQRIHSQKVFAGLAERGHTSTGWFFGFKLHLVVNDSGELLQFRITPGNVDDRKPVLRLTNMLFGKVFADKGYISQKLVQFLHQTFNLQLITKLRSNMKNQLMQMSDRLLLHKRAIIETIIDQLKNISQIEHSRHRSVRNFFVNVLCGLIAYSRRASKPSLKLGSRCTLPA